MYDVFRRGISRQRAPELVALDLRKVRRAESLDALEAADNRIKRRVLVQRRARIPETEVSSVADHLLERGDQARLSDAGVAADEYDPAFTTVDLFPSPPKQLDFFVAADQWQLPWM